MQSFPELTRSPDALQANSRFFSSAAAVLVKEIREPGAQSSGRGGRRIESAVVDEEMQFIDWKKEFHCLSLNFVGAAGRTDHEAKLTGSAMQK